MKNSIAALVIAVACASAWALPTLQEVETAVQQGHYAQAETMMAGVVAAKPDNAKAHYVYAQTLAHNANFTKAITEAAQAQRLDPAVKFTTPDKFQSFEQLLQREQTTQARTSGGPTTFPQIQSGPASSGVPGWIWAAVLAVAAFFLWRGFSRSRAIVSGMAPGPGMAAGAGGPYGAGPAAGAAPYGPGVPQASAGSGMLGTGLAVAGGVAGGMLLDEMLHHRQGAGSSPLDRVMPGGLEPSATNEAANELERRPVDFGNGGNWDSGGAADVGGGSDGGGWD